MQTLTGIRYNTPIARDEVFGFLIAGYETTSTTVSWGVKLLSDNQQAQATLRKTLRLTYSEAFAEKRQPTAKEIATLHHPYIDATLEEILRCGKTAGAEGRVAMVDTEVFGYPIPKGTDLFFLTCAGYVAPPVGTVDESKRSATSQAAKDKTGVWDISDIGIYKPERWLSRAGEKGEVVFDKNAGPNLPFGLGVRGCFGELKLTNGRNRPADNSAGRRLAYIELRMLVVFIIWNFELLPAPEELSTYAGVDRITHQPLQCYLRLKKAGW